MATTLLGSSPPPFPSHPTTRTQTHFSSSSQTPPPPQEPTPPPKPLSVTSTPPLEPVSGKIQSQKATTSSSTSSADSTDWIASSLTRRFGLGAGLAWAAFLGIGVLSEQIKTRLEVSQEQANIRDVEKQEEVVLPNGIRYYELRVGGGATPRPGDLVVIDLKGSVEQTGQVFVDTFGGDKKKPLALVMGSRPYSKGMCEGIEYVLKSMKSGGKRRVIVPPQLGFGEQGAEFEPDIQIPPNAVLEFIVEVMQLSFLNPFDFLGGKTIGYEKLKPRFLLLGFTSIFAVPEMSGIMSFSIVLMYLGIWLKLKITQILFFSMSSSSINLINLLLLFL